jgi:hypothetical protein
VDISNFSSYIKLTIKLDKIIHLFIHLHPEEGCLRTEHWARYKTDVENYTMKNLIFPKLHIVTDLLKPFLSNGSVNTFQRATIEDVSQWTNVIARC